MNTKDREWMDSLPDIHDDTAEGYARSALEVLSFALTNDDDYDDDDRLERARKAGAYIIAWREGIGVSSRRTNRKLPGKADDLLWHALKYVAAAAVGRDEAETSTNLRHAETALRAFCKELQSTNPAHGGEDVDLVYLNGNARGFSQSGQWYSRR